MLAKLYIKNYALIRNLEMLLSEQLNIITGETGAGKSILLGALGLLLGNRAETKTMYEESDKCIVEGEFNISNYSLKELFEEENLDFEEVCIIRREISPGGKSRAFINDTPVNLDTLRAISSRLVDIHSQHDTQLLGSNNYQLEIIDTLAGNGNIKGEFKNVYKKLRQAENVYQNLLGDNSSLKKEYDYDKFLYDELEKARLAQGEQEQMEEELNLLENAEEVKTKLAEATYQLSSAEQSVLSSLYNISAVLTGLTKYSDKYRSLKARVDDCLIELKDIAEEIETEEEKTSFDPEKIDLLRERLSLIYTLQKKHGVTSLEQLIDIQQRLKAKLEKILNLDEEIEQAKVSRDKCLKEAKEIARKLSDSRKSIIAETEQHLVALLQNLGISNASVKVSHSGLELTASGTDEMKILFTANKGLQPQELKNAASGGEFSRLMLALKYLLATKIALPTIIFDEIDTGVSGEVAIKMGRMMKEMANKHQVIAITHLPQIASQGKSQYFVYKDETTDRTISNIRKLNNEERILEIAKMIGGEKPSAIAISNAKELLGAD